MRVVLSVPDMSCGHCVGRIRNALEEIGVESIVDLASRTVAVEQEDEAAVRLKLESIDYPVSGPS